MEHDTKSRKYKLTLLALACLHATVFAHPIPFTGSEYIAGLALVLGIYKVANVTDNLIDSKRPPA